MTELISLLSATHNGIPLYDWLLLVGMLLAVGSALMAAVGSKEPPRRQVTRAGNPTRKRSWLP